MSALRSVTLGLLALVLVAASGSAQDAPAELVRVEVVVTARTGDVVLLDRGRDARIEPGDLVELQPPGAPTVEARIRDVARESARARLTAGSPDVAAGTPGVVLVPRARLERESESSDAPEHPPWPQEIGAWDPDQPLLAPVEAPTPAERAAMLRGRAWTRVFASDSGVGAGQQYVSSIAGADLDWSNPFSRGGRLHADFEVERRDVDVADESTSTSWLRLDRLVYEWGGDRSRPDSVRVGRMFHSEFPELGLLDGVEYVRRTSAGHRVGASLGYAPRYDDRLESGEDAAVALFYRWVDDPETEDASLGLALQKTWHEGKPDRDLAIADARWRPSDAWVLSGTAWIDLYDSGDAPKSSGLELTELHLHASWRPSTSHGARLSYSRLRWPVVLGNAIVTDPPAELDAFDLRRTSVSAWRTLGERTRVSGRLDRWEDDVDSGLGGDVSVTVRDLLFDRSQAGGTLFSTGGRFVDSNGARLWLRAPLLHGQAGLRYELARSERTTFLETDADTTDHAVRASWDGPVGAHWQLSLFAETRDGDEQDSLSGGFTLQRFLR